jgi:hypothetical protein
MGVPLMYTPSIEEQRLVQEYGEAVGTKRLLSWCAIGAAVLGVFIMPIGLVLWAGAALLGVLAARTSNRIWRIRGRVNGLRTFQNSTELRPGSIVSLIPSPFGMASDQLVGRVGSAWEGGGDAEILSEPLGGTQLVSKHSGSFSISRGDWVVFHREEEDGQLTIWKQGPQFGEIQEQYERSGDERDRKLAQLQQMNQAQARATGALEDLLRATEEFKSAQPEGSSADSDPTSGRPIDDPDTVWDRERIIDLFGISEEYFSIKYMSYTFALRASGKSSHWNADIDEIAREKSALTEAEIALAKTDFERAVLNRVKLALTMERAARG